MKILIIGETNIAPYDKKHFAQIEKVFEAVVSTPLPARAEPFWAAPRPLPKGEGVKRKGEGTKLEIVTSQEPKKVTSELGSTDIIITSPFHQNLIDLKLAKNLKWVHVSSAGVTDIAKFLAPTDIFLTNSSGVHPIPISEHVATFMLMFARQIHKIHRTQIEKKTWARNNSMFDIFEMNSTTVGIVGYGRIGSQVAQISKGLGANVAILQHAQVHKVSKVFKVYKEINQLLKNCDFVVNCLPLTPETEGYFDMKKIKQMNTRSYFINIGRGKTVVEKDLILALKNGIIAGAGLDVFETEPLPDSSPLWKMENVIVTPHVSGWTPYYTDRVVDIFCENMKGFLTGKKMPTLVDKKRGY